MFSLIYVWINSWVNNREAGDLRRYRGHYDVIVMIYPFNVFHSFDNAAVSQQLASPYPKTLKQVDISLLK